MAHSSADTTLSNTADGHWVAVTDLPTLTQKGKQIVRPEGRQICLILAEGRIFAVDNRCPHEGYPLREGSIGVVDGRCMVTCNWHNWKFDLETGANLYGGDKVRAYPVSVKGQSVLLDLTDPPPEIRQRQALDNIRDAMADGDSDRIFREVARLEKAGGDPLDALRQAIQESHEKLEFGFGHGYAAAADWLSIRAHYVKGDQADMALSCLAEPLAHIADEILREGTYAFPPTITPWDVQGFIAAVEAEDEETAVGFLRGALRDKVSLDILKRAFTRTGLMHYAGFAHAPIYVLKAFDLIEKLGESVVEPLLLSLTRHHLMARREDLIPEFRGYADAVATIKTASGPLPSVEDYDGANAKKALELTSKAGLSDPEALLAVLLQANARIMATFDCGWMRRKDVKPDDSVNWLDMTHAITLAEAVLHLCRQHPENWADGLIQLACFVGRNSKYTGTPLPDDLPSNMAEDWYESRLESMVDHGQDGFIVAAHIIKTPTAAEVLRQEGFGSPVLAYSVDRFLEGPLDLRQVRRTAKQALAFVALEV